MRQAISLSDLIKYADKLPARFDGKYYRMSYMHEPFRPYSIHDEMVGAYTHYNTLEFRQERTKVNGVPATAWYYHDVLVKVCV